MKETISVTGLGYVGLPLAVALADHFNVIGFDIDGQRVKELILGDDRNKELTHKDLIKEHLEFTSQAKKLAQATFHIIAVPTPVDESNRPDLSILLKATETVAAYVKPNDMVVFESTVYPGATIEECLPIIEQYLDDHFHIGYSPERINPGDREHTIDKVVKIIASTSPEGLARMRNVYGAICKAGLHEAPSIQVAEAAKVLENTQRDINVALMNEFAIICDRLGLDTLDVLAAAKSKWNFLPFTPGLVGGHCIGVDPYYLIEKSEKMGYTPQFLKTCRRVNDGMGEFIAQKGMKALSRNKYGWPKNPRATVMGFTFKENCPDVRNSKVADIVHELRAFGFDVQISDPLANSHEVFEEYGFSLVPQDELLPCNLLVIANAHNEYKKMSIEDFIPLVIAGGVVVDVKGILPKSLFTPFLTVRI